MDRRNIVIFLTDGHRADCLGCYGNNILQTPNIDQFANEGVRFTQCFSAHTVCMPTRASIFTGRYPHVHGVWANGIRLSEREITLPQVLADNDYRTCATGKIHFEPQQAPDYPSVERAASSLSPALMWQGREDRCLKKLMSFIG
jgi:arylsulfatase A-like enzyme